MDRFDSPRWGGARLRHRAAAQRQEDDAGRLPNFPPDRKDGWIDAYILFLERCHKRLGGGAISAHYLDVIARTYSTFCATGDPWYRWHSWRAIQVCCQWLAQLQRPLNEP
jgi:hypothetical protein